MGNGEEPYSQIWGLTVYYFTLHGRNKEIRKDLYVIRVKEEIIKASSDHKKRIDI